jgi:hypothetical protein
MAHQDQRRTLVENVLNRWQRSPDSLVISHDAFGHGHVEVHAHQNTLALKANVTDGHLIHGGHLWCY